MRVGVVLSISYILITLSNIMIFICLYTLMIFLNYFYWNVLLSTLIYYHTFHTWASGSDDRGNPIPRIDVHKLIDWFLTIYLYEVIFFSSVSKNHVNPWLRQQCNGLTLVRCQLILSFLFPLLQQEIERKKRRRKRKKKGTELATATIYLNRKCYINQKTWE